MSEKEWAASDRLVHLRKAVENMPAHKVVLVGDVMLDRYIHGYANNLDPTAAVPVLKETSRVQGAGAAAHVARGLASLGLAPQLFSVVGDDESGSDLLELLEDEGVDVSCIAIVEGRQTTVKTRLMASRESLISQKQLMMRWDEEDSENLPELASNALIAQACESIADSRALVISDYGKGVVTDAGAAKLMAAAVAAGVPVITDPKLTGLHRIGGAGVAIMKERGLELLRRRGGSIDSSQAAQSTLEAHGIGALLIAGGQNGTTLYRPEVEPVHFACGLSEARQQIGLLDAANVAVTAALADGRTAEEGTLLANAACEVILAGEESLDTVLTAKALATRLDESAWSMHISQR